PIAAPNSLASTPVNSAPLAVCPHRGEEFQRPTLASTRPGSRCARRHRHRDFRPTCIRGGESANAGSFKNCFILGLSLLQCRLGQTNVETLRAKRQAPDCFNNISTKH